MVQRSLLIRFAIVMMVAAMPFAAFADNSVGTVNGGGSSIDWAVATGSHDSIELRVVDPNGEVYSKSFKNGKPVSFRLQDLAEVVDGQYNYELRVTPKISSDVAKKLEKARAAGDDAASRKIMREAGLSNAVTQTGSFRVLNRSIVFTNQVEADANDASSASSNATRGAGAGSTARPGPIQADDQVIPDDLIVQGSTCTGLDCVNNENFGFDTLRLKENNLRIHFDDTSVSAGFPANDWRLIANDSASGGSSKFSIEDSTSSKTPFTVTAGASTNSIFVDSTGRVGMRTSTPVLDLHINTSNTPAIRLEQNNSGGFTAQTWDIGANEANFFVRDVTGGSRLSFRIRPGAPTSSVDISSDGDVGIGTGSPDTRLHVVNSNLGESIRFGDDANNRSVGFSAFSDGTGTLFAFGPNYSINSAAADVRYDTADEAWAFLASTRSGQDFFRVNRLNSSGTAATLFHVASDGNTGINCNAPGSDLVIGSGSGCSTPTSSINAGGTAFISASSRTFKENIEPIAVPNILDKIANIPVMHYDYKQGPKDRVGLIAEDFHQVFNRGDEKYVDGTEVQLALWMAVQELTAQNKALNDRLVNLEKELKATK